MSRKLTPQSSLEALKKEAKRWLKALRVNDPDARARLARALPDPPADPGLRDVQHALACEHGLSGWAALQEELVRRRAEAVPASRDSAIHALLAAAERGDARRVAEVLDAFPDIVNERNAENRTALHLATIPLSEATIEALLARGADPNLRDDGDNAMPLHFAAERGHLGIVRRLIEHGADPIGAGDLHELEVIGWATAFEATHTEVAEYLLAHGARPTIDSAVALGDTSAIGDVVARAPADLDRPMDRTNHRRRPLHLAVLKSQPASLDTLLSLGADVEAEDAAGLTPLEQAALSGQREMARRLLDHGARVRLPAAVALAMHGEVERLLRAKPDSLRPGGRWDKLILRASERASAPIVEALLRAGASVHVRDDHRTAVDGTHGYTPLHAAAFRGNADVVRVLLRHGANPADREDKYWGTPAGWADYAGHAEVRDLILEGPIDLFDAIAFDRSGRIDEILARDPLALDRPFGDSVNGDRRPRPWLDPAWTPVAFAVANGKLDAVRLLAERGADLTVRDSERRTLIELANSRQQTDIASHLAERDTASRQRPRTGMSAEEGARRIADFLLACLDWRTGGSERLRSRQSAGRLLERHPEIARANLYTAVVCGEIEVVRRLLGERPAAAQPGGPRLWPPLLYLCAARLPVSAASEHAVEIARLLLDHGADPNAFYLGGNADIYYTALTCVLGRGEEQALPHPQAPELARLLLERGANPHDTQVLYNVFADHASRRWLDDDIVWLLELMYEHSTRRGHAADWKNPEWPMFAMRGAPSLGDGERVHPGARFLLEAAIDRNLLGLAEWLLAHGAGPDVTAGNLWRRPARTLVQEAIVRGHTEMVDLLVRYGATPTPLPLEGPDAFVAACLAMDRERVTAMLAQHPEHLRDPHALFAAVARDRADVVAMLLDLGVSPDLENPSDGRRRALHVAAFAGAERSAALLIERGADVDARETHHNAIPLGVAAWAQQPGMIALLGRHSRSVPELTYTGQVERLREVLREDPTRARSSGETALQWLPSDPESALSIAMLLLDHGVDPGGRNAQGDTAADLAERHGLEAVAAFLRSRGG